MPFNQGSNSQSSRFRNNSSSGGNNNNSVQPMYGSDRQGSSSRSSGPAMNDNPASMPGSSSGGSGGGSGGSSSGSRKNDSEWQKVRHKQQRLLLLRHASRCQYEAGKCPVTPHCASMKELWKHIAHCKDQQCSVQHCMSSRYVLSHYRRCKDQKCPACGPVRETIRKSHEKEKNSGSRQQNANFPDLGGGADMSSRSKSQRTGDNNNDMKKDQPMPQASSNPAAAASSPPSSSPQISYEPEPKRSKTVRSSASEPAPTSSSSSGPPQLKSSDSSSAVPPSAPQSVESSATERKKPQKPLPTPPSSKPENAVSKSDAKPPTKASSAKANIDRSLLKSFSTKELETHLASLNRQTQLPPEIARSGQQCRDSARR